MNIRNRPHTTTHVKVLDIGLTGHHRHGADLSIEIHYTLTPDIPALTPDMHQPGEPAEGGEVEITDIRPFRMVRLPEESTLCNWLLKVEYLTPVPDWLDALLRDCIDTDLLTGDAS